MHRKKRNGLFWNFNSKKRSVNFSSHLRLCWFFILLNENVCNYIREAVKLKIRNVIMRTFSHSSNFTAHAQSEDTNQFYLIIYY